MSFSEIFDALSEPSILGPSKSSRNYRSNLGRVVFYILFFVGLVWAVIELPRIFNLFSELKFAGLALLAGIFFSVLSILISYWVGLFDHFTGKDYRLIVLATILLTVASSSYINRKYGKEANQSEKVILLDQPSTKGNLTHAKTILNNDLIKLRLDREFGEGLHQGDSINIKVTKGFLGFDFISSYSK